MEWKLWPGGHDVSPAVAGRLQAPTLANHPDAFLTGQGDEISRRLFLRVKVQDQAIGGRGFQDCFLFTGKRSAGVRARIACFPGAQRLQNLPALRSFGIGCLVASTLFGAKHCLQFSTPGRLAHRPGGGFLPGHLADLLLPRWPIRCRDLSQIQAG